MNVPWSRSQVNMSDKDAESSGRGAQVDAYVARTDPNLGVISLAKHSHFVDPRWQQSRSASADCIYVDGEFDISGSLISRVGTLNGIGTAKGADVHVAGGDMLAEPDGRKSPCASAGPSRGASPNTGRLGPDFAPYCDQSYALEGVRAGGTRSAVAFRLVGTSAAAPQLARRIANPPLPAPKSPRATLQDKEERGGGNIEPPQRRDERSPLLDHVIGGRKQRRRKIDAEGFRRLTVEHHLELGRLLHR